MNNFIHFKSALDSGYDAVHIYQQKAACIDLRLEVCPYCGHVGCSNHGYYQRQCRDLLNGELVIRRFRMLRAKCRECGHTHAVRCGIFAAYRRFSQVLIDEVNTVSRKVSASIMKICDSIPISPRTVSRWRADYSIHTKESLSSGPDMET